MKKTFNVTGMSCDHCRRNVEKTLNDIEGVKASVTLTPPMATIEFTAAPLPVEILQKALTEAGDYSIYAGAE